MAAALVYRSSSENRGAPHTVLFLAILCFASAAIGQTPSLDLSISPSPVGAGARAAGMANAFVAVADDATAASWNPAGLVQLERAELSIVGSYNRVIERFEADVDPVLDSQSDFDNFDLNFLSFVQPFQVGERNASFSLSFQQKYDFTRSFNAVLVTDTPGTDETQRGFLEQSGSLSTITPSLAIEITRELSLGVSINLWRSAPFSKNDWMRESRNVTELTGGSLPDETITTIVREDYSDFEGENLNFGMLWAATQKLNLGFRYETAFSGTVDYVRTFRRFSSSPGSLPLMLPPTREQRKLRLPATLVAGVAYRFNDRLTVALDMSSTDWDDFYVQNADGSKQSLVDGRDIGDTHFDRTYTVRLGGEYVFIPEHPSESLERLWTVRGGVFYDEEPAAGRDNSSGSALATVGDGNPDPFWGLTAGIGLQAHNRINFDLAYQLRMGFDVNADAVQNVSGFSEDLVQHRILFSAVIYLDTQ